MATEIDKTIEELEAEVLAELEEANGADAPKKSATKAEPMDKIKPALQGDDKPEDLGKAVTDPKDATDPGKEASKKAKEVSGDSQQKGEGKPDAIQKIKEEDEDEKSDDSDKEKDDEDDAENADEAKEDEKSDEDMKKEMIKAMKSMKKEDMAKMYASYHSAAMSKTKDEMYKEMSDGLAKMKKEGMKKLHASVMPSAKEEQVTDAKTEERLKSVDVKEHVDALLNADDSLSKEFKEKAATIFETAVKSKIREEIKRLEEEYQNDVRTEIAETRESLTTKVDSYLDYVTGEWMKENELAVERGLKAEIAEDFHIWS